VGVEAGGTGVWSGWAAQTQHITFGLGASPPTPVALTTVTTKPWAVGMGYAASIFAANPPPVSSLAGGPTVSLPQSIACECGRGGGKGGGGKGVVASIVALC
jgi:hypothetical protein